MTVIFFPVFSASGWYPVGPKIYWIMEVYRTPLCSPELLDLQLLFHLSHHCFYPYLRGHYSHWLLGSMWFYFLASISFWPSRLPAPSSLSITVQPGQPIMHLEFWIIPATLRLRWNATPWSAEPDFPNSCWGARWYNLEMQGSLLPVGSNLTHGKQAVGE